MTGNHTMTGQKPSWAFLLKTIFMIGAGVVAVFICAVLFRLFYVGMNDDEHLKIGDDVLRMYLAYSREHHSAPSKLEQLRPYSSSNSSGWEAISQGRWTVEWNVEISDNPYGNGDRIIAFESKVPIKGGHVRFANGTGEFMDPNRFKRWKLEADVLHEIGQMYLLFVQKNDRVPVGITDFDRFASQWPKGYSAIKSGEWVIIWGTRISDQQPENHDRVVGYESRVTGSAGWVLMADGSGVLMVGRDLENWTAMTSLLHDIGRMYLSYCHDNGHPPKQLADFEPFAKDYVRAWQAIRDGSWVVRWGTELGGDQEKADSQTIIAYEKNVPTTSTLPGGWVLMGNNGSRQLIGSEFRKLIGQEARNQK
jgi:hypothetical protein